MKGEKFVDFRIMSPMHLHLYELLLCEKACAARWMCHDDGLRFQCCMRCILFRFEIPDFAGCVFPHHFSHDSLSHVRVSPGGGLCFIRSYPLCARSNQKGSKPSRTRARNLIHSSPASSSATDRYVHSRVLDI